MFFSTLLGDVLSTFGLGFAFVMFVELGFVIIVANVIVG